MARSKRTPETSKLVRAKAAAFARRQRGAEPEGEKKSESATEEPAAQDAPEPTSAVPRSRADADTQPEPTSAVPRSRADADTQPIEAARPEPKELPDIEPPPPRTEPWPDATPPPMKPVEPTREKQSTVAMPVATDLGRPPEMPRTSAPPPLALGSVEDPTHMPGPKELPAGDPDDPAPAPGRVPPGDSRSLRRGNEFALVYRVGTCVITRTGTVGTRGHWRVVEYPTSASAGNSYAKECSRFVSEGFSDYRD